MTRLIDLAWTTFAYLATWLLDLLGDRHGDDRNWVGDYDTWEDR